MYIYIYRYLEVVLWRKPHTGIYVYISKFMWYIYTDWYIYIYICIYIYIHIYTCSWSRMHRGKGVRAETTKRACGNFSKVSSLLNLLHKIAVEQTFEKLRRQGCQGDCECLWKFLLVIFYRRLRSELTVGHECLPAPVDFWECGVYTRSCWLLGMWGLYPLL